jgi:hypothetical protein
MACGWLLASACEMEDLGGASVIENVRDVVLIVVGIVWGLIFLAITAVTLVVFFLLKKYLGIGQDFLRDRVGPMLEQVQERAEEVRQRTAALPRYDAPVAPRIRDKGAPFHVRLPFFRRRKPWWQKVLPS